MPSKDHFSSNLSQLRRFGHNRIADHLEGLELPDGLLHEAGEDLNINLGHSLFYQGSAAAYSDHQVAQYLGKPSRFYVQPPMFGSVYLNREEELYQKVFEKFGATDNEQANSLEDLDAGYLLSFGVGMGLHLPRLIEALDFRDLIVVEQFWEFLALSMTVQDWTPIFEELDRRSGAIHFIVDGDSVTLANAAFKALRGRQFGLIDGSYGFQHYRSPVLDKAHDLFRDMLPSLAMSEGFFDDECVMFRHARANLAQHDFSMFDDLDSDSPLSGKPFFIVGSGPSVDQSLEAIKANQDNAVIMSAGTGLGVLLRAGIKPHIHCETENLPIVYKAVQSHKEGGHDFSGIHLIASPTVDPRIPAEFDHVSFVFRQSLTSSLLFCGKHKALDTGATVANFACRIAMGMRAGRIYLFGVDLGAITKEKHHSVDSTYLRSKDSFWQSGLGMLPMDQEVPGNFREKVYSNALFMFTRIFFHNLIAQNPATRFFNCSDGAKIEGAIPLQPTLVRLADSDSSIVSLVAEMHEALTNYRAGDYPIPETVCHYRQAVERWHNNFQKIRKGDFFSFYNDLRDVLDEKDDVYQAAAQALNSGTVLLMVQFGYFYLRRLSQDKRQAFLTYFYQIFDEQVQGMLTDFEELLQDA